MQANAGCVVLKGKLSSHIIAEMNASLVAAILLVSLSVQLASCQEVATEPTAVVAADTRVAFLDQKSVDQWTVTDVELWMNYTIGFPEYSSFVRKHQVDGPTLAYLTDDDIDTAFPIEASIHLVKLRAHIDLLKRKCICSNDREEKSVVEFWTLLRKHNFRMWFIGVTSLQFPRLSMLYTYYFDHDLYVELMTTDDGTSAGEVNLVATIGFWFCTVLFPDSFMLYQCLRLFLTNYFVMPFFIIHFGIQQYNEAFLVYAMYRGDAFEPGLSLLKKIWALYQWFLLLPVLAFVTSYFLPILVQQLLVGIFFIHIVMVVVGLVMFVTGRGNPTEATAEEHKKE